MGTTMLVCWVAGLTAARIPPAIVLLRLHADPERTKRVRALLNATAAIFSFAITLLLLPTLTFGAAFGMDGGVTSYTPLTTRRNTLTYGSSDASFIPFYAPDWFGQALMFVGAGVCLYIASLGIVLRVSGRSVAAELRPAGFGFRTGFGVLFALTAALALAIDGSYSLIFFIVLAASALVLVYQANADYRDVIVPAALGRRVSAPEPTDADTPALQDEPAATDQPDRAEPEDSESSDDEPGDEPPPRQAD